MQQNDVFEITRSISKTGALGLVFGETLHRARELSESEKVSLYCQVRDESRRMESEWRDEFIEAVGIRTDALPAAESGAVDLAGFIVWARNHADRGNVLDTLEELLEQTSPAEIRRARQLIVETGQDDLLSILDECTGGDDGA